MWLTWEPQEPNKLEEAFYASLDLSHQPRKSLLTQATTLVFPYEQEEAFHFLARVQAEPPQNEDQWLSLAQEASGVYLRFTLLKIAVKRNQGHKQAWEEILLLCQKTSDVSLKEKFQRESWNCAKPGVPFDLLWRIIHTTTRPEKLEAGEMRASEVRDAATHPVELDGIPICRFRDWVVTTAGIESVIAAYDITWQRLWEPDLEAFMESKGGAIGSFRDFVQALVFARTFFPVPSAGKAREFALKYKQELSQGPGNWFEQRRVHQALGGIRVRSKSEVIIANLLTARRIAFAYEQKLEMSDGSFRYPDFTLIWRGQSYYWEHLGMLEDVRYLERCDQRLRWYREHNLEKALIITTEVGGLDCDALLAVLDQRLAQTYNVDWQDETDEEE